LPLPFLLSFRGEAKESAAAIAFALAFLAFAHALPVPPSTAKKERSS
jgi:hypothetical protein